MEKRAKNAVVALIATLGLPFAVWAAEGTPDGDFYKEAAQGGMAEVALGTLAQQKSHNPKVNQFGAMMASDHSAANAKLKSLADSKNVPLPASIGAKQLAVKTELQALSGEAFDKAYIKDMVKDHQEDIALFEQEAAAGLDPEARSFAAATLPTLRAHLEKIQAIANESGVTAAN